MFHYIILLKRGIEKRKCLAGLILQLVLSCERRQGSIWPVSHAYLQPSKRIKWKPVKLARKSKNWDQQMMCSLQSGWKLLDQSSLFVDSMCSTTLFFFSLTLSLIQMIVAFENCSYFRQKYFQSVSILVYSITLKYWCLKKTSVMFFHTGIGE